MLTGLKTGWRDSNVRFRAVRLGELTRPRRRVCEGIGGSPRRRFLTNATA